MDSLFPPTPRPYSPYAPTRKRSNQGSPRHRWPRADDDARPRTPAECEAEVARIAQQLDRIVHEIPWGRVQNDAWDGLCQFIFHLRTAQSVRQRAEEVAHQRALDRDAFVQYALRRWFCFWGARLAELLFVRHPNVEPGPPKDHEVDFRIDGIPFDLKTSDVPRAFQGRLPDLLADPSQVATWFYTHQSRERRFHTANRLFLVLCDPEYPEEAWRLRADVVALRTSIDAFLANPRYLDLTISDPAGNAHQVLTAVILVRPRPLPRQMRLDLAPTGPPRSIPLRVDQPMRERQLPLLGDVDGA
jgi:hypothetical protein